MPDAELRDSGGSVLAICPGQTGARLCLAALHGAFLSDCLGHARKDQHGLLDALIRPIFQAGSGEQARERLGEAVAQLVEPAPKAYAAIRRVATLQHPWSVTSETRRRT